MDRRKGWTPRSSRPQGVYVSRIAGTDISVAIDACRSRLPVADWVALSVKVTCMVSSVQTVAGAGLVFGHEPDGASERKLGAKRCEVTPPAHALSIGFPRGC